MKAVVLAVFLVLSIVNAHNWLEIPVSRNGNQAFSGSGPCDPGPTTNRTKVNPGGSFVSQYSTNHPGDYWIALVNSANLPASGGVTQTGTGVIFYSHVTYSNNPTQSSAQVTITVPSNAAPGSYVLQFWWSNWWNCADVTVNDLSATNPTSLGGSNNSSSNPSSGTVAASVIGALVIAAALALFAILFMKGQCRLSTGARVAVFGGSEAATFSKSPQSSSGTFVPLAKPSPAPHTAISVAPNKSGSQPLPPDWDTAVDDRGNVYYYHIHTNQTQWERPVA